MYVLRKYNHSCHEHKAKNKFLFWQGFSLILGHFRFFSNFTWSNAKIPSNSCLPPQPYPKRQVFPRANAQLICNYTAQLGNLGKLFILPQLHNEWTQILKFFRKMRWNRQYNRIFYNLWKINSIGFCSVIGEKISFKKFQILTFFKKSNNISGLRNEI